ncbi:MAG: PAC2 family protein [Nanoarchaeota archaeon]
MKIELNERPKSPTIIEGFPGFGFVSTITTEFLIKHLNAKRIGSIYSNKLSPMIAIHNSEVIEPLEIHYAKKNNIVILRALTKTNGIEWEIAEAIVELAKKLKAKEVIGIEGIASDHDGKLDTYCFTNMQNKKFSKINIPTLSEGIIVGVTGVLLLKKKELPLSCIFVEANPDLPDSRAAGEIIKILDSYLGLKVDYKPLLKTAAEFESRLKEMLTQTRKTVEQKQKKEESYLG